MPIPVIWHAEREFRGRFNCTSMLNEMFDRYDCLHLPGMTSPTEIAWRSLEGAVVVVHGGRQPGSLDRLNMDIADMKWVLLIFLGDEEASFPAELVEHPNMIAWVQEPLAGKHDFAKRFILDGYPHDCKPHPVEKDMDWVFAGQVTHERRRACVDELRKIDWGGIVVETKGFCQGVSREEYYRLLSRAKIVPCPSGPMAQDAARPWEALQCGAIPILDDLSPVRHKPGFWQQVLGPGHPLPVLVDWSELPRYIREIKPNWEWMSKQCLDWWSGYKEDFNTWLHKDIDELCTKT